MKGHEVRCLWRKDESMVRRGVDTSRKRIQHRKPTIVESVALRRAGLHAPRALRMRKGDIGLGFKATVTETERFSTCEERRGSVAMRQ